MPMKIPERDPINADRRRTKAAQRVGVNALCGLCAETRAEALIPNSSPMICAECQRKKKGKTHMDQHHIAGKSNSPLTISIPTNDHRAELSTDQHDWPRETLENPNGCPLRMMAAKLRGFDDTVIYLIDTFLTWCIELAERLSDHLIETRGPEWWKGTPLEKFANGGVVNESV